MTICSLSQPTPARIAFSMSRGQFPRVILEAIHALDKRSGNKTRLYETLKLYAHYHGLHNCGNSGPYNHNFFIWGVAQCAVRRGVVISPREAWKKFLRVLFSDQEALS